MVSKKSKSKSNPQQDKLFAVYQELDQGKINNEKFIAKVRDDVGLVPTEEFVSYVNKEQTGIPKFAKIQQTLKIAKPYDKQPYTSNVKPKDVSYKKGHMSNVQRIPSTATQAMSPEFNKQEEMSKVISSYLKGEKSQNDFRAELMYRNITMDEKLTAMVRKQECGDKVTFNQMGQHIFRQINGTETYNRVDKPNMNNQAIVNPSKSGAAFVDTKEMGHKKKKVSDAQRIDEEARNATGIYLPKKGGTHARNNAFQSNLFNVIDQVKSSQSGAASEYYSGFRQKNLSQFSGSKQGLLAWDETNYNQSATAHSRKRSENQNAFQSNGSLW